jgi:hypothetical protein
LNLIARGVLLPLRERWIVAAATTSEKVRAGCTLSRIAVKLAPILASRLVDRLPDRELAHFDDI